MDPGRPVANRTISRQLPKSGRVEVDLDASNGYSLVAQVFLQLLTIFNVGSVLDEDELCKIVVAVSRRKQTAVSCRSLGLNERIPGIIEELVKRHKQIDAVHFVQAFGLSETFPPACIYVEELKDSFENNGDPTATSVKFKRTGRKELNALRAVIKCIEEYKLQKEYSLGPLQKRGEKRQSSDAGRTSGKKPRGPNISFPRRPTGSVGATARRPPFPVSNWQRAPAPMPSRAAAPMPPLPDIYGVLDRYHFTHHQPQHTMRDHFLLTANHSVPQNRSSTPQGQWQHHTTIQVRTKLHMVVRERRQVPAAMQLTPAHQGHQLPATMQII
ncbi:hypothetical protein U9M48_015760 [Paspalum notatum var. saurae]|uniref:FRIGIDA-like protein n=1 Tax=Paspalum notatum var. saurae TaxID=547442 RepID=A0AAQ3T7H8_PASNO